MRWKRAGRRGKGSWEGRMGGRRVGGRPGEEVWDGRGEVREGNGDKKE